MFDNIELAYRLTEEEMARPWPTSDRQLVPPDLESMSPGVVLAAVLARVDRSRLNGYDAVRVMQADARMESYYAALKYESMAEVAYSPASGPNADVVRDESELEFSPEEIGTALQLTRRAANIELSFALALHTRIPRVAEALQNGVIDVRRAKVFDVELAVAEPDTVEALCDRILPVAGELTTGQLRARLQRAVMEAEPEAAMARTRRSVEERWTCFEPNPEGTADLYAYGIPLEKAARAGRHINGLAYGLKRAGDERTIDQLRVDVLIDLLTGEACGSTHGGGGVHIVTSLQTLAGLSEEPGEIEGLGPIVAEITRQVAGGLVDGPWTAAVTCDHGQVVHVGTVRRRPTARLKRHVRAHYPTCVYPGCRVPAVDCDLDHRRPWSEGGVTCSCEVAPLCRRHHRAKDKGGWKLVRTGEGHFWTSPLGHTYARPNHPP